MTQAVNLANFANYLDSSGGMSPSALNAATPVSKGGTGLSNPGTAGNALVSNGTSWESGTPAAAVSLTTTNFSIVETGSGLVFKYGSTVIGTLDSSGNFQITGSLIAAGNVSAYTV